MPSDTLINLEEKSSELEVKKILKLRLPTYSEILKSKLMNIGLTEIIAHVICLVIIVFWLCLIIGESSNSYFGTMDTFAKLIIGGYLGKLFKSKLS
ncbi:MAG TPA: hypothetical protein VI564_02835 [Candidatus Nanoarchaeia archaeon]|nr:hypothetical protein [Candidatus Nanoarchaeia archaeon]